MRIIDGPFTDEEKPEKIKQEVIKMLNKIYGFEEEKAKNIYKEACHKLEIELSDDIVDLDIWTDGASLRYSGGEENRIEVVKYNLSVELSVETPAGTIYSKVMPDDEYIGIATLIRTLGEPGTITEYDPEQKCIVTRVYSMDNPDGKPFIIRYNNKN